MSMIEQQVKELRELADGYKMADRPFAANTLYQVADTIEALSAKLQEADCGGGWIPCKERLPEDGIEVLVWFEYFRYGEYNRLFQTAGISFTYNGQWSGFVNGSSGWNQLSILAWQPLPEPYQTEGE